MALPLLLYGGLNKAVTGDLKPGFLHTELRSLDAGSLHNATLAGDASWDEDEGTGFWHAVGRACGRILSALLGTHGLLSHFPILLLGILGVTMVMHRHWPGTTKILASAALAGASAVLLAYGLARTEWKDAMFANRWFLVFLPMVLFWSGAWLRKSHRPSSWAMVVVLLSFSTVTGLVGATDPQPRQGYNNYTAAVAFMELVSNSQPPSSQRTTLVNGQ
jgi:uncharacterized membrane protein